MTSRVVIMLSRLRMPELPPATLADFQLNYEQLESEAKQIRLWKRVAVRRKK